MNCQNLTGFQVRLLNDPERALYLPVPAEEEPARAAFVRNLSGADVDAVREQYGDDRAEHVILTWEGLRRAGHISRVDNGGLRALYSAVSVVRCARHNARK